MENIALAAVKYLPAFSLSGLHLAFTVHPYQTFKQIQHNLRGGILLYLLRVERAWVAMIVVTRLVAGRAVCWRERQQRREEPHLPG